MDDKNKLIKIIKYRLSYTGTKETDIVYQKMILGCIPDFNTQELLLLCELFNDISDVEISLKNTQIEITSCK